MTNEVINVSYTELEKLAVSFDEEAQLVAHRRKRIDAELTKLKQAWIGDAASHFQMTMPDVMMGIHRLEASLHTASLTIRDFARIFRQAEDEATALLDQRMAGGQAQASALLRDMLMLGAASAIHPLAGLAVGAQLLSNNYTLNRLVGQLFNTSGMDTGFGTPQAGADLFLGLASLGLGKIFTKNSGEFTKNAVDVVMGILSGQASNLLDDRGDASLNGLIEKAISAMSQSGVEIGLDALAGGIPVGTAMMIGNDAHQLFGNLVGDGSLLQRNLLVMAGGNTGGLWYGNMTDSINEFRAQIDKSDIGNLFDSFGKVANDVYFRPVTDSISRMVENPSLDNMLSLGESVFSRLGSGPNIVAEQLSDPARLNQTLTHAAEFIGTVADTGNALVNLPGTYLRHSGNMVLSTAQGFVEHSGMFNPTTRAALLDFTQQQYGTVDHISTVFNDLIVGSINPLVPTSYRASQSAAADTPWEVLYQGNASEEFPRLAKPYIDVFTHIVDQFGIDDVMRNLSPIRVHQ